jgi:hypothetical protein
MKIRPSGRQDRKTDMTKLTVSFIVFTNGRKTRFLAPYLYGRYDNNQMGLKVVIH